MADATGERTSKSFRIGALLTFIPGMLIFVMMGYYWILVFVSVNNPSELWRVSASKATYTLDFVRNANPQLADDFVSASHIEMTNLVNTGFAIMLITWFGLRHKQRWAWWSLLGMFLWVGLNDTIALLQIHQKPLSLMPMIPAAIGMILTRSAAFGPRLVKR